MSHLPDYKYSALYFSEILASLQALRKTNAPELSDFSNAELATQLERAFAAIGHAMTVHIDMVALENYIGTARLLQSFIEMGRLVDYRLSEAMPAKAPLLAKLNQVLSSTTTLVKQYSDFSTFSNDPAFPAIVFENVGGDVSTIRTDQPSKVFGDDQGTFTDHTAAAIGGGTFAPWGATTLVDDALYVGHQDILWDRVDIDNTVNGSGYSGVWEYFDAVLGTWALLTGVTDTSNGVKNDGILTFTLPQNAEQQWGKTAINGVTAYWVRYRVTATGNGPTIDTVSIHLGSQYTLFEITQGSRITNEALGSSDGTAAQNFVLGSKPVIFGSVVVEVDEGGGFLAWTERTTFLNSTATDKHFQVTTDFDEQTTIHFGDGVNGKAPAVGVNNVRASYRVGGDVDGNVGEKTITVNKQGIGLFSSVSNPRVAAGWKEREGDTDASRNSLREKIPSSVMAIRRAVSISDFQYLAINEFTDSGGTKPVSRAFAVVGGQGPNTVEVVTVAAGGGFLTVQQKTDLTNFYNDPLTGRIVVGQKAVVTDYVQRVFTISGSVVAAKGVSKEKLRGDIQTKLLDTFKPDALTDEGAFRWEFGQKIPLSVILCLIQDVDGAQEVELSSPSSSVQLDSKELPKLSATNIQVTVI